MDLVARLETRKNKEGKEYQVIIINLTDTYEKMVFLQSAELELVKMFYDSED